MHKRCIYFLRSDDAIKIGCSTNLRLRISQIERDISAKVELIGFIYGNFATENLIHKRLAPFAEGNEWFRDYEGVRELIQFLLAKGPLFQGLP